MRSYWVQDWIYWHKDLVGQQIRREFNAIVGSGFGELQFQLGSMTWTARRGQNWATDPNAPTHWPEPHWWGYHANHDNRRTWLIFNHMKFSRLGFGWHSSAIARVREYAEAEQGHDLYFPYWFMALATAILPAWRFGGWKRRRRRYRLVHGLCINCGYDLRATPDAAGPLLECCPECGAPAPASAQAR